jgi:hypothetical protein
MKLKIVFLFLLITCFVSAAPAQEKPELFSKIERAFKEKEPAWKVERIFPRNTSDPLVLDMTLRSGEDQASVQVAVWKREKDAQDVFTAESAAFANTAGKGKIENKVSGLGDENHLWTNSGSTAWPMLKFRKGNVNVTVFAPSVAVAKKFAQHILEQITTN